MIISENADSTEILIYFSQKKCFNHKKRKASSICLHEDCWKSECDKAFFCANCIVVHAKEHEDSVGINTLFTDEFFDELDEYQNNPGLNHKLEERIKKFDEKIEKFYHEIEELNKSQFVQLKHLFECRLQMNYNFEAINNLKVSLCKAKKDFSMNYQSEEKLKS